MLHCIASSLYRFNCQALIPHSDTVHMKGKKGDNFDLAIWSAKQRLYYHWKLKLSLKHLQQITLFGSTGKVLTVAVEWVAGEGEL
jgi:hypothetical protein